LFGLGLYIYAGEDIPQAEVESIKAVADRLTAVANYIKEAITRDDGHAVLEAWEGLSEDEMRRIWVAESKGGFFSQAEKTYIRQAKFAAYGNNGEEAAA
jgi:hypothetical protein